MNLIETVVHRPITVVILFALFIGLAGFLVPSIPVELFPDMEMPVVMVMTQYGGAGPEDVEQSVTKILEQQLSNVSDLKTITSTSSEGFSIINLEFDYSKNLDDATNDIRDKLELATSMLPDDAGSPIIYKMNSDDMPVLTLAVLGDIPQNQLRSIAKDTVQPLLERIGGVASINIQGGQEEIIQVNVSQNRLEAYNMMLSQVAGVLSSQNYQVGSGDLQEGATEFLVRTDAEFSSIEEIAGVVIASIGGGPDSPSKTILLKDVADVSRTNKEEEDRVFINSKYGVTLSIQKESDANSISVSENVIKEMNEINRNLPDGTELLILSDDSSAVESIMSQTYTSLIQGIILAMLVLFFFLRTWSSTIIIALSIPISIFITILFMFFMGLSINLMTLTGLILGLGMVVDGSIVIQENIFKYRERGTKLKASAILGSREMIMSITASTLTTICVFIPMILFANDLGMIGQVFKSLSYTIIIALAVSLVVALTFVPAMSANYLKIYTRKQKPLKNKALRSADKFLENGFTRLDILYKSLLNRLLDHKGKVLLLVFLLFLLSMMQFTRMGIILAPAMSEDTVNVTIELPQGTPLDETEHEIMQLVSIVEDIGGYENIIVTVGESGMFGGTISSNKASIEITLPEFQQQTISADAIKNILRQHFNDFPATTVEFASYGSGLGNNNPVDILIKSDDLDAAVGFADDLKQLIKENLPGITEPKTDMDEGLPELEVVIDRQRAYSMGLDMYSVASEISASMNGKTATTYREGGDELNVQVILREEDKSSAPDLNKIFVVNKSGTRIAVSNVAHLEKTTGPVIINREDESRTVHVQGGLIDGYAATQAQDDIRKIIELKMVVPDGVYYSLGGDFEDIANMGKTLVIVAVIAILLVFGIMAAQFESLKDPFIIFFTIPLMMIGVIGLYRITGETFSIMSAVGLVVLVGLVVNSGIVLVDYINKLLKRGYKLRDACVEGAGSRLRPILMTTATTILGMFPLAFLGGAGTEQVQPIAQTIIGGLLVSSLMTLFVTPALFAVLNRRKY
jgi:HAE1 family hydrophobic/amphiphilic exporter-1